MREELHLGEFLREIDQQPKIKWLEIQPLSFCPPITEIPSHFIFLFYWIFFAKQNFLSPFGRQSGVWLRIFNVSVHMDQSRKLIILLVHHFKCIRKEAEQADILIFLFHSVLRSSICRWKKLQKHLSQGVSILVLHSSTRRKNDAKQASIPAKIHCFPQGTINSTLRAHVFSKASYPLKWYDVFHKVLLIVPYEKAFKTGHFSLQILIFYM